MKAVVLAGGFGTRMLPFTKTIPKELLPVGNKPVIQYTIEGLVKADVKNIVIISSQWKKALEDYFDKNYELEELLKKKGKINLLELIEYPKRLANIVFLKQIEQNGTGHAVYIAKDWIDTDYFFVVFGDAIYHPDLFVEVRKYREKVRSPIVVVNEVPHDEVYKYGVVRLDGDKILSVVEKPKVEEAPSNLVISGVFLLPKEIFSILQQFPADQKSGEIYLPPAVLKLKDLGFSVYAYKTLKFRDIGNPKSWLEANSYFYQNGDLFVE